MVWLSSAPPSVDHHLCSTRSDFRSEEVKGRGRRRDDLLPLHALRPHGILWVCPTFSRKPCLRYVVGGAAAETGTWTIARDPVSRTTPGLARAGLPQTVTFPVVLPACQENMRWHDASGTSGCLHSPCRPAPPYMAMSLISSHFFGLCNQWC